MTTPSTRAVVVAVSGIVVVVGGLLTLLWLLVDGSSAQAATQLELVRIARGGGNAPPRSASNGRSATRPTSPTPTNYNARPPKPPNATPKPAGSPTSTPKPSNNSLRTKPRSGLVASTRRTGSPRTTPANARPSPTSCVPTYTCQRPTVAAQRWEAYAPRQVERVDEFFARRRRRDCSSGPRTPSSFTPPRAAAGERTAAGTGYRRGRPRRPGTRGRGDRGPAGGRDEHRTGANPGGSPWLCLTANGGGCGGRG